MSAHGKETDTLQPLTSKLRPWIDPALLEVKFNDCICSLCFGVMFSPTTGCKDSHSFCSACLNKHLATKTECPQCTHTITSLVRNMPLAGMISQLRVKCQYWQGQKMAVEGDIVQSPKRMKLSSAKTNQETPHDVYCTWTGTVEEVFAHTSKCDWATVKCPGCMKAMSRKEFAIHTEKCKTDRTCPNDGCDTQHPVGKMNQHLVVCGYGPITCPCPGCDMSMLRREIKEHVRDVHFGNDVDTAVDLVITSWMTVRMRDAVRLSEVRYAGISSGITEKVYLTSWIFNWRVTGWSPWSFQSEPHYFGGGVTGACHMFSSTDFDHSHFIGMSFKGLGLGTTHTSFQLLDKWDKCTRLIFESGSLQKPTVKDYTKLSWGTHFTPTAEDKEKSQRVDGSVRLRVVVRLFRERPQPPPHPGQQLPPSTVKT